ncbi:MAG: hypothetical protein PVH59_12045 [Anaerolineae bacterium]|jgi:hypothetical protein
MFYPTTGMQVASHDAWLEEMQKEPSDGRGKVVKASARRGLVRGVASRLAGALKGLRSRPWSEVPAQRDKSAQTTGASI